MRIWRFGSLLSLVAMAALVAACGQIALPPGQSPEGTSAPDAAALARTVQITMHGDALLLNPTLTGDPQTVSGSNGSRSIVAKGPYVLRMNVNLSAIPPANPSACPQQAGSIPWESGLIAFVQGKTPRSGALSLNYDKIQAPQPGNVDSWETTIDQFNYKVQFFRWSRGATFTNNPDGSTTVFYRGGSIEVFKKRQGVGTFISREQCFGDYVSYDLTAR